MQSAGADEHVGEEPSEIENAPNGVRLLQRERVIHAVGADVQQQRASKEQVHDRPSASREQKPHQQSEDHDVADGEKRDEGRDPGAQGIVGAGVPGKKGFRG